MRTRFWNWLRPIFQFFVPPHIPLEAKVLKFTCLAVIISSCGGIIVNASLGFPLQLNLIIAACTLVIIWLYKSMPLYSHYNRSGLILILTEILTLSLNWFASGGLYSSNPYFFVLLMGFAAVVLTGRYLWVTLFVAILTIMGLVALESLNPQWIHSSNPQSWQVKFDILFAFTLLNLFLAWFTSYMLKINREQYERAEKASHAKSIFLSQLSHELRTPLNAVIGFSGQILTKENLSESKIKLFAQRANTNGIHLLALVNQIMDVSLIEAGKLQIFWQKVNLRVLLTEIDSVVSQQAREKKLEFVLELPPENTEMIAESDPNRLRQIILNLISNAIKYSPSGQVVCRLSAPANTLRVDIIDQGPGIPEDKQELIFEPFNRLDIHKQHDGTGMGLTISRTLCQYLGCDLFIHETSSQGSTFSILVPIQRSALTHNNR